jgi:hypothetical protein
MNLLLIYPEFPDTFWSFRYALKFIRKKSISPPLGLLTIAAMLPAEWNKRLVDLNTRKLTDKDLAWADYVFISGMAVQRKSAREVLDRCHAAGVKVVAGGPLFTLQPDLYEDVVDHFILVKFIMTIIPINFDFFQIRFLFIRFLTIISSKPFSEHFHLTSSIKECDDEAY